MAVPQESKTEAPAIHLMKFSAGFETSFFQKLPDLMKMSFDVMDKSCLGFKDRFQVMSIDQVIEQMIVRLTETLKPYLTSTTHPQYHYNHSPLGALPRESAWIKSESEIEVFFRILLSILPRDQSPNDAMVIKVILLQIKSFFLLGWAEVTNS